MSNEIKLSIIGLIPIVVSVMLYYADIHYFNNSNKIKKQIIYGIILGFVSILGTEYGVLINGAVMNARDAAPICAGLIFGPISGIISGLMGGIERYFAVFWGAGAFTRIACSVSTILAGIYAAALNKYVFDKEIPKWYYGLAAGVIIEVSHMLMVFITNIRNAEQAFNVVKICTIPMILVNSLSVMVTVILVRFLFIKKNKIKDNKKSISQLFLSRILIVCLIAFILTTSFSNILQRQLAYKKCDELLSLNILDAKKTVIQASDENILNITHKVANDINKADNITNEFLISLADLYNVHEINYVNKNAIIEYSTDPLFINFDMKSGEQSKEFLCLFSSKSEYVQAYGPTTYDKNVYRKYAAVILNNGCFVQVGYDSKNFSSDLAQIIKNVCYNRHVGNKGSLIIANSKLHIMSDINGVDNQSLINYGFPIGFENLPQDQRLEANINGIDSYYKFSSSEGYYIIAIMPISEAMSESEISIYLTEYLEVLVFTGIFLMIFFVVKNSIIKNINKTNDSLNLITQGQLDTIVDVRSDKEFNSLSDGINTTVNKLKDYIKETNDRIEAELKYASEIQHSALPNSFPAFPEHDEFDIYATMNAAKSVGGDFYDFYIVDDTKLVMLMADVSGKGIPAALFMMRAKTLIKSYAEYGISVEDVFTNANYNLCEGNEQGLFVTAWICILDIKTGHLIYSNAGHNPPLIKHKDGKYEYLKSRPGFVLGGMEGIAFKKFEIDINEGDEIYLYTDGVTEAQNINNELYGEDRLLNILNSCTNKTCKEICEIVKEDVDKFVDEADQFDDLTMLSFKYLKK